MNFDQRIFQFIGKNKLMPHRGKVLVGVSGGADSMALLLVLTRLRHDLGVQLHAAHFNHRFRPESDKDESFVAQWCKESNIPLIVGKRTGPKLTRLSEDKARRMRFEFFIRSATDLKAQCVALAHTRNDLAETVLMRLMRGSGLYGLRAIMPLRSIEGVRFVRPLLCADRFDIIGYLKARKTPFCTDATNFKMTYERNKVRLRLLPLLARDYNPRIVDVLSDLARSAGEDYDFLSRQAGKKFKKYVIISGNKVKIDLKSAGRQHPAVLRLLFRQMAESLGRDPSMLSFDHIHALGNLILPAGQGAVDLPLGLKAVKTRKYLEFCHA